MTIVAGPQLFHSWKTWVKPVRRAATVAHTWNGDGEASMNSQRPCAVAVMFTIFNSDVPRCAPGYASNAPGFPLGS